MAEVLGQMVFNFYRGYNSYLEKKPSGNQHSPFGTSNTRRKNPLSLGGKDVKNDNYSQKGMGKDKKFPAAAY
jgi:hypothetical protein